jgi:hypothetical protein
VAPDTPEFQEAKTLILSLLETPLSYPKLSLVLERVDSLMEGKDPITLLIALAHAFRGREAHWQEALEQTRLGVERNIKLSTCLEYLFLSVCKIY